MKRFEQPYCRFKSFKLLSLFPMLKTVKNNVNLASCLCTSERNWLTHHTSNVAYFCRFESGLVLQRYCQNCGRATAYSVKALSDLHSKRNILLRAMLKLIARNKLAGLRVVMADAAIACNRVH